MEAILETRGFFTAFTVSLKNISLAYIPGGTSITRLDTIPTIKFVLAALFLHDPMTGYDVIDLLIITAAII